MSNRTLFHRARALLRLDRRSGPYPAARPDWRVPPGQTLAEHMEIHDQSVQDIANGTGLTPDTVRDLVEGRTELTEAVAQRFERVTGIRAVMWLRLEEDYRAP